MKVSIVTPTFNRTTYLNETIESVITQAGDFEIEYIIQDGGSDQALIDILIDWDAKIKTGQINIRCKKLTFKYYIENDNGMYDAINKGFSKSSGDIMAWINSDDRYYPNAFMAVKEIFEEYKSVRWLTGLPNGLNRHGSCISVDKKFNCYSQTLIGKGYYRMENIYYNLSFIQQESTFWTRSLWMEAGGEIDTTYQYAGDFHLWIKFANFSDLVKVESLLGTFRRHDNQLTNSIDYYIDELPVLTTLPLGMKFLHYIFKYVPQSKRLFFNKYNEKLLLSLLGLQVKDFKGRVTSWCVKKDKWVLYDRKMYR